MTRNGICTVLILMLPAFSASQEAQDSTNATTQQHVVTMTDGSRYIGRVTDASADSVIVATEIGELTIPRTRIRDMVAMSPAAIRNGEYWFPDPNSSRLYVAPTARMLKQGEGYFSVVYLFLPGFQYGISDNVTLGGGMSIIPGVPLEEQLFYFTPKVGAKLSERLAVTAGALLGKAGGEGETAGILYAGFTSGTPEASITAGLGYGFAANDETTMFIAGGSKRLSRRISFVSENWYFPEVDEGLISYGLRFFGEALSADLCLINDPADPIFPGVPFVDFVFNF